MKSRINCFMVSVVAALVLMVGNPVFAEVAVDVDGGVRSDANFDTDKFAVDNVRLSVGADTSYGVSADVGVQYDGTDTNDLTVLDAVVGVDVPVDFVSEVRVGRFLAPQDRAGLDDVYGQVSWDRPSVVSKYPSVNGYGRLDGASVNGGASVVNYSVGVFQGIETNNALVAGRVDVDVFDVDLGFAFQTQSDADLTGTSDFFGWNLDVAYDKKVGPGTVDVSGGFFKYDLDGAAYVSGAGLNEGLGGYFVGAYAFNDYAPKVGSLTITPQPFVQYQNFQFDGSGTGEQVRWDVGVNLILNEETNTKLTVSYFDDELLGVTNDGVLAGVQFAF